MQYVENTKYMGRVQHIEFRLKKMKKQTLLIVLFFTVTSCSEKVYQMTADGEQFNSLTQITEGDKPSTYPHGGDFGTNLVFVSREADGHYNICMKEDVLKKAYLQKTDGNNFNIAPQYCSSNDKIVFQYFDKNNFDIYYIEANKGKAITQVTNTDENEYNPAWSPDGNLIVFEKGGNPRSYIQSNTQNEMSVTKNQVWLKNLKSNELKLLGEGSFPKISNDGKNIVYVKYEFNKKKDKEQGTIWTMNIDGELPKQITNAKLGYATNPNWSPDGKSFIFQLTKANKIDSDIYTIDINGENLKQYTSNKSNDFAPYWSVDDFVYFASDRKSQAKKYQIWRFKIK